MTTQATQQELDNASAMLKRHGYEVEQKASHGFNPYLVVQDPVHKDVGGKLVLMCYEPVILRNYDRARAFINVRS